MISRRLFALSAVASAAASATLAAWPASAQPQPALTAPRLVIAAPAEAPVVLRSVRVRTEISGRSASTEVTLTFYNPNPRPLEGELQFPLREGQSVVGMAMDVNGVLRDAVPIEKARGEAVFEDVTRTRIDPALLSVTQGDNYKLRVYPLPARGEKVVVLRLAEWLEARGGRATYRLPLGYGRVDAFTATLQVGGVAARPTASARGLTLPAFTASGAGHRLELQQAAIALADAVDVELALATGAAVTTQRLPETKGAGGVNAAGGGFFVAQLPWNAQDAPRAVSRVVTLAWDASGSGAQRDHARELALLDAYFARAQTVAVRLVRLRDAAEPAQRFDVKAGDWRELRTALQAMVYDGATDLGALRSDADTGEVLLFSDGLSNFGTDRSSARLVPGTTPIYAINAAARADAARLRGLAEASGGRFIDLTRDSAAVASATLLRATDRIVALESDAATDLVAASTVASDGTLTIAGRLRDATARVRVVVARADGRRQTVGFDVDTARDAGTLAAPMWARLTIASLSAEYEVHRAEIRRLGLAHGIVTRDTSLIILDRAQDYARHGVTPPPELAAEVAALSEQMQSRERAGAQAQLERVVTLFEAKQAWWARAFPKGAPPKAEPAKKVMQESAVAGALEQRRASQSMSSPLLAQMAPPSPSPAPAGAMADRAMAKSAAATPADAVPATTIRLRPAANDAPYLTRLRALPADAIYRHYLDERADHTSSTAFFLDVAELLFERGQPALALRVLSNLAEMDLENRALLRILGARLVQANRADLALPVLRRVLVLAPDEPQSQRDLGLALAAAGQPQAAVDALYEVARRQWPRFPEIELIALAELNAIVATSPTPLNTARIDPRLLKNLPLALRATLAWDTDNTDIDLWVTDPNGEAASYANPLTYQGGRMSRDITSGYGPEEFSLKDAKPGTYVVHAKFYGHRQQIVSSATTLQLQLTTGFGTPAAKQQSVTLRLKQAKDQVFVGEFEVR